MKYKVGDRVKVREDLGLQKTYGSYLTCNDSMVKKAGLVVTIKECDNVLNRYKIDTDDWNWCDEMFEGLAGGEAEKAINLLREMKHNCEHANKYDDPKRHDKAKALGFAIELIEHGCSAEEPNYKPEKPEEPVKLYTWKDLCDYEILLHEKWRIVNEQRQEQYRGHKSVMQTLRGEYLDAIERTTDKLGRDVPVSKAKEFGFEVK